MIRSDDGTDYGTAAVLMLLAGSVIAAVRVGEVTCPLLGWMVFAGALMGATAVLLAVETLLLGWRREGKRRRPTLATSRPVRTPHRPLRAPAPSAPRPAQPVDNARAQQLMLGTRCADCGHIGYDMETYFLPSWYLGRCPDCGHSREFTFPS